MIDVNGQQYQHATTTFTATSTGLASRLSTLSKLTYDESAEVNATHNSQGQIDGFTIKEQKIEAALTMKLAEWFAFRDLLASVNPGLGIAQMSFDLAVSYGQSILTMRTERLLGCHVTKEPRASEDNQEADMVELSLFVALIDRGPGKAPFLQYQ